MLATFSLPGWFSGLKGVDARCEPYQKYIKMGVRSSLRLSHSPLIIRERVCAVQPARMARWFRRCASKAEQEPCPGLQRLADAVAIRRERGVMDGLVSCRFLIK